MSQRCRTGRIPLLFVATALFAAAAGGALTRAAQQQGAAADRTIWDGIYLDEQAQRGALAYGQNCARCHGDNLQGDNRYKALVGDTFWNDFQGRTMDDLFAYVSTNMPNGAGGSLATNTYLDLVSFILSRNEVPAGNVELTVASTEGVQIIPQGGLRPLADGTVARVVGCLTKGGASGWMVNNGTVPARATGTDVAADAGTMALGDRDIPLLFVLSSLDRIVGHRVWVRGILVGEGGADGINVTEVISVSDSCQ